MKKEIDFQGQRVICLEMGPDRILVAPQIGARLLRWESRDREIVHWPDNADWSNPRKIRGGNPILFPFIARHFLAGQIERWQDSEGTVREMPMHGFARDCAFAVEDSADHEIVLRLDHSPATEKYYPFPFTFRVSYLLQPGNLTTRFTVSNPGTRPLPYYAGHHFYFTLPHADRASARLQLPSSQWGRQLPDGNIDFFPAETESFTLDDDAAIDRFQIGPEGGVFLQHPAGYRIDFLLDESQTPWHTVTTWTMDPLSDFYCIEPWLGLPNAIHHHHGLRLLAPGSTESAECRLKISF